MAMARDINIAIDGPAGAGKSTVAKLVAKKLGLKYIDTGAMYRALTLKALQSGTDLADEKALGDLASNVKISIYTGRECVRVVMDGKDVTEEIRAPCVSRNVSAVARVPAVRRRMVKMQKQMAKAGGVVMEGRDVGTFVLPEAEKKIFLTASVQERARRRWIELKKQGFDVSLDELAEEIAMRDRIDSTRKVAPLVPAPDAVIIDCSCMDVEEVVNLIVDMVTGGS